jgi:hypothetical protein
VLLTMLRASIVWVNYRQEADHADIRSSSSSPPTKVEASRRLIYFERELVLETVPDVREMPESCLDERKDSTGIIKPDVAEWSFGSTGGR